MMVKDNTHEKDDLINIDFDIPYILEKKINLLREFSIIATPPQKSKI